MTTAQAPKVQIETVTVAHGETGLENAERRDVLLTVIITRQLAAMLEPVESIGDLRAVRTLVRQSLRSAEVECAVRGIDAPNVRFAIFAGQVH
ncbi:hypothetical protein [Paraburkholderia caballeronis]|uniref:Uncharacterized protein n=1 Tax=Paraburkholderia caballeronis TaxID=416943 RepID=A0A1H7KZ45_9BURK|nr:hypothetical protein [Paraburkholderia caballeronis]PXW28229.1 hypothetical protein C7403_102121 [Paraburkholderia caballeronis]PXX03595.1 hypothetical protein C7407_102121 [Paraburkholderia caballeronis]RAK04339.1 hypothetical protein C7409_102121 [Paraburkholderia caballeronis]SED84183.1 hypothetical protein SAMN05445871_4058 [Paraburkholderia caballeronis]SEK92093.1 hypothetical protein SAMN05192542_104121 [Paraburkholderia caballeronis]